MNIKIYAYGFGDRLTKNETVLSFEDYALSLHVDTIEACNNCDYYKTFDDVLQRYDYTIIIRFISEVYLFIYINRYNSIIKRINLSSPTSFAPIINRSIELVKQSQIYHILFIIADGKVSDENEIETIRAIENASNYALSIVVIGVGDGPWDTMIKFDNKLINRKFDNFQFVDYHRVIRNTKTPDLKFALHALMEIPEQYKYMKKFSYI